MTEPSVSEGVEVRRFTRRDATVTEVFSVRVSDVDGTRRRRSFDSLEDALDYRARLRSARRWRPEKLRQEQAGTQTLGAFFEQWWVERRCPGSPERPLRSIAACVKRTPLRVSPICRCARSTRAELLPSAASC